MSQIEPALVRELRKIVAGLEKKLATHERFIEELRGAVVALMEPDMPRILRTPGGIMVLDKKPSMKSGVANGTLSADFTPAVSTSPATEGPARGCRKQMPPRNAPSTNSAMPSWR